MCLDFKDDYLLIILLMIVFVFIMIIINLSKPFRFPPLDTCWSLLRLQ
jgi:hypothetical protein